MKRRKANYLYAILSVALVLFLLGFFGTAWIYTREKLDSAQEALNLMVELKDERDSAAFEALQPLLESAPFTKVGSVRFVSKEAAQAQMMAQFPEEKELMSDGPIPFYDAYALNVTAIYLDKDSLEHIRAYLKENTAVSDVYIDENVVQDIAQNIKKIALAGVAIGLLFIVVAITLIHNTIRLNLYADRFIIKNMELVGASWGFITRPYIWRSLRNGFLSAFWAIATLGGLWYVFQKEIPDINSLLALPLFWIFLGGLVALGLIISWISTYYVVNKYLKMRLDDLY